MSATCRRAKAHSADLTFITRFTLTCTHTHKIYIDIIFIFHIIYNRMSVQYIWFELSHFCLSNCFARWNIFNIQHASTFKQIFRCVCALMFIAFGRRKFLMNARHTQYHVLCVYIYIAFIDAFTHFPAIVFMIYLLVDIMISMLCDKRKRRQPENG